MKLLLPKTNSRITRSTQKLLFMTFCFLVTTISYAQFDFASETEPNNLTNDSGVQTLTVATTNTTTIFSGGTAVDSDEDYWKIGRSPFVLGSIGMAIQSNSGSSQPQIWLEKRTGSYDGPLVSNTLIHPGTDQSNRPMTLSYTAANEYYLVRAGGNLSGGYNYRAHFPRCDIPGLTTVLSTDPTENDFTITGVAGSTNISLIKINTVNSFTDPSSGYTYPTATTATNVAYSGSGEQTVYMGNSTTPNVTISGLTANTTYYVKVFNYSDCGGNLQLNAGNVFTVTTCGATPTTATALNLAANNESSSYVSSITGTTGASIRYVVKANTTNSFTAPANGTTLPTANAVYGAGQQVVYVGDSATPNELITGLTTGTEYFFKVYTAELCGGNYYFESTGVNSSITPVCSPPNSNAGIYLYAEPTNLHNSIGVVNFTGGNNADGKIIYMSDENNFTLPTTLPVASLPNVSTDYSGKTGQTAIYTGAATGFRVTTTGLSPNTTYYYAAVNYKICNGVYYFYPTGIYSQQTTCGVTSALASGAVLNNIDTSSMELNSFTAPTATVNAPDGYVIKMNTVNSFSPLAIGVAILTGNTVYAGGEQVIYSGTSVTPNLNITGLSEGTQYFFTIYAYKDCNGTPVYQQTGYTFSQSSLGLNFTSPTLTYNDPATALSSTTTSTGAISYSLINDTTGATLVGSDFTPGAVGSTTLRVSVVADGIYQAISKDYSLTITKATPVITWNAPATIGEGIPIDASYLNATANVPGTFEYYTFYNSFINSFSGRITEGVTTLPYGSGFPTTIYTRFIPNDTNYNVAVGSTLISVTSSGSSLSVEITPNDIIKAIGSADPTLTSAITSGALALGHKIWAPFTRVPGETEGTYVISLDPTAQAPASFDRLSTCPPGVCIVAPDPDPFGEGEDISVTNNYTIQTNTGTFTITSKEQVTITLDRFDLYATIYTANPRSAVDISSVVLTSDGSPVSPTVNLFYAGNDILGNSYAPSATPPTNAGNYTVIASVDSADPNYFGSVTGNFTINQRYIAITPDTPQTKVYDGSPKTFEATATGLSGENIPLRISYRIGAYFSEAAPIEIGSYPVSVYASETGNHNVSYSAGTLVITDNSEVTITLANLTQQFDNTQKPVTVSSIETSPGVAATPTPTINITYEGINGTNYNKTTTPPRNTGEYKVFAYVDTADANFYGSASATLTIFDKEYVTFNFGSGNLTYNGTPQGVNIVSITDSNDVVITPTPVYTISYDGEDYDGNTYGPTTVPPTNAGDYTITVAIDAADPTYQGNDTYDFTINTRAIEVTADAKSKVYGEADPAFTYQITNGSLLGSDVLVGSVERAIGEDIGTYAINQGALNNSNYSISFVESNLGITARPILLAADFKTKVYGETDPTLTHSIVAGNVLNGDMFSGELIRVAGEDVGNYRINQGTLTLGVNYTIIFNPSTLGITQRVIEVTADPKTKVFGDPDPTFTYQITAGALQFSDAFAGSLSRVTEENVGTYAIEQGTLTVGPNYNISYISDDLTIGSKTIEITADALNKQYGDTDPALTYQITSGTLVGSDIFTGSLSRVDGEDVGDYVINQGTLALNPNYALSYVSNNLTIGERAVEIAADAKTKVFGDVDPALTYQITSGSLVGSDAFTGNLIRVAGENVGAYAINQGSVALNANYTLTYVSNNLTINQRAIEITPDAKSKIYGDADPVLTYQITAGNLMGSDAIIGILERAAGENVGTYAINQGTLGINPNYAISLVSNDLEITTRAIEVTADGKTKIYGDADPAFTYAITSGSLAGSDTFTGALDRIAGQAQGNYAINQGTLSLGANYDLTFVPGNLFINYRFIRVIPVAPISKTYGDADPDLTWPYIITQGSLAFDDTLETYGTFRSPGENIGRYQIRGLSARFTSNNGGESSYSITFTNGGSVSLDITARSIEVTADAQAKVYGDTDPALSYQITNGALQFSDAFTGSLARVTGEAVGNYTITQGSLSAGRNYTLTYISNDFTIGQRAVEITADDLTKVIGSADPIFGYQVTSGALQFFDAVTGNLTRVAGETLGNYGINQGTLSVGSNYNLTFVPGNLTITNLIPQAITFGALSDRTFGDADFALTATGGASGNPVTYVSSNTAVATISGNIITIVGAGSTTITASQMGNSTYADAIDVQQILTVNKGDQTITFASLGDVSVEASAFSLNATATSGLGVTYTSSNPAVATVTGNTISVLGIGTTTITASQTGDANWNAAIDVMQTLTVVEACPMASLPADNIQVQASSETCTDKNNGIITINAGQAQNYIATINSQTYNFTSDLTVTDLAPGTYPVCVAIAGFTNCEQCFELVIEEAPVLNGKTTINSNGNSAKEVFVEIATGTAPFTVKVNDAIIGEYNAKRFMIEAQSGDTVEVSSSRECEGKLSKTIDAFADVTAYPNPTRAGVTLTLPNTGSDAITVEIYNALGVNVSARRYPVTGSKVILPMENLPAGIYFVTLKGGTTKTFKIIKE
ncbi:MBG domain-containing protein [Aquimarina algiphila]|uniref:T9SS type A sorting domain-containing protein n=1 Tax=Aquimarina algiphila TaxID=2047982 RepID=A0A554VP90_9FLAO|nr:MBG domain-containing protein [Aquimarina algiphila]TSE10214.1 T9SS type A sorting domain-containing protein [Aquimarina algiphila]